MTFQNCEIQNFVLIANLN